MNLLQEIRNRFQPALARLVDQPEPLLAMIRPAQDPGFGDYQANCAMPLGKRLGRPPRDVAQSLLDSLDLSGLAGHTAVAGPGFINIRLDDELVRQQLQMALADQDRLGISRTASPRKIVIDFSSPNVAKPMHVGHIRSTVIGDSLARILRFLGNDVITDNHLGDWGTQFGMIIFGYKQFLDDTAWRANPVAELSRLYRMVRGLMDYQAAVAELPEARSLLDQHQQLLERYSASDPGDDKAAARKLKKDIKGLRAGSIRKPKKSQRCRTPFNRCSPIRCWPRWLNSMPILGKPYYGKRPCCMPATRKAGSCGTNLWSTDAPKSSVFTSD